MIHQIGLLFQALSSLPQVGHDKAEYFAVQKSHLATNPSITANAVAMTGFDSIRLCDCNNYTTHLDREFRGFLHFDLGHY